jgi:cyclase
MPTLVSSMRRAACLLLLSFAAAAAQRPASPSKIKVATVAPHLYVVSDSMETLMAFAGKDATIVGGVQSPTLVARLKELLRSVNAKPVRHAVLIESERAPSYADGGWTKAGAMTFVNEGLWVRLWENMHPPVDSVTGKPRVVQYPTPKNVALPAVGFSQVIMLYAGNGVEEEVHFIHERSGYSNADLVVHWERSGILYLPNSYTTDGYPLINVDRGGRINNLITTVDFFVQNFGERAEKVKVIVPGRGPLGSLPELHEYRDMLIAVRDSVQSMIQAGKTVDEAVAAKPSARFDARWGKGPVTPDQFVASVYKSWRRRTPANP